MRQFSLGLVVALIFTATVQAETGYDSWPLMEQTFESTGGGGVIIRNYDPVVSGATCSTRFTATEPNGTVYHNEVEFDALEIAGGILCTNGRWRALDGSASGTTPFKVFVKDGVRRRMP